MPVVPAAAGSWALQWAGGARRGRLDASWLPSTPGQAVPQGCLLGLFQNSLQKPHFDPPDVEVIGGGEVREQSAGIRTVIQVLI